MTPFRFRTGAELRLAIHTLGLVSEVRSFVLMQKVQFDEAGRQALAVAAAAAYG